MPLNKDAIAVATLPFPNVENGQVMDESIFDGNNSAIVSKVNELIAYTNNLKTILASVIDGDSGADNISATTIVGVTGATIQSQMENVKSQIDGMSLGQIPDASLTPAKMSYVPLMETINTKQTNVNDMALAYTKNREPSVTDNYASGYRISDSWYIPNITLNNLLPTPLAINAGNYAIANATTSVSGSAITLTCLNGFNYASIKKALTPTVDKKYLLFCDIKCTSDHTLSSFSINDVIVSNPVKNNVYHLCTVLTAPSELEIKVQAATETALTSAVIVVDKMCVINLDDMGSVPFTKEEGVIYFPTQPAFATQILRYASSRWYCTGNGTWQSSSQLSPTVASACGLSGVNATTDQALHYLLPVGTVINFAADLPPEGFLICNHAEVSRTTYAKLYSIVGTRFGVGDGSTTFNLPGLTSGIFVKGSNVVGTFGSGFYANIIGCSYTSTSNWPSGQLFASTSGPVSPVEPASLTLLPCIKY